MPSKTASIRQPQAPGKLFQIDDYPLPNGRNALSVQLPSRHAAAFYAEHPDLEGHYGKWNSCSGGLYLPGEVNNADEALDLLEKFTFPLHLRHRAMSASRHVQSAFSEVAKLKIIRDLPVGRIDRRKLPAMAESFAAGDYDPARLLPFRRIQPAPARPPTLAIVASAGNAEMWSNAHYIPEVLTLAISVLWACEAAGLPAYAALCMGHYFGTNREYAHMTLAHMLATPYSTTSLKTYGYALHRDLWRMSDLAAIAADPALCAKVAKYDLPSYTATDIWPSLNGGYAVSWARHMLGADLVIAIGDLEDIRDADIQLSTGFNTESACKEIARQAEKLKGAL